MTTIPRYKRPALNVRDLGRDDFQSAPDAKPMGRDDIRNIAKISSAYFGARLDQRHDRKGGAA